MLMPASMLTGSTRTIIQYTDIKSEFTTIKGVDAIFQALKRQAQITQSAALKVRIHAHKIGACDADMCVYCKHVHAMLIICVHCKHVHAMLIRTRNMIYAYARII